MQCKSDTSAKRRPARVRTIAPLAASITALLLAMAATSAHAGDVCEMEGTPTASTAAGLGAVACGVSNDASGDWSIAFGRNNQTTGNSATAMGGQNVATGSNSTGSERSAGIGFGVDL